MIPFNSPSIEDVFNDFNKEQRKALLSIRNLIYDTATRMNLEIEENLKWGQPSYNATNKLGSPIRLYVTKEGIAVYFHCQTTLISSFRHSLPSLNYEKNRAILLDPLKPLPIQELEFCIAQALTYHKKS